MLAHLFHKYRHGLPAVAVFLMALAALLMTHHPNTGWNVNTRLALVVAVVENGTFSIDGLHEEGAPYFTMDKAFFEERFYSDKIFGVSLLALPLYAVLYHGLQLFGEFPSLGTTNFLLTLWAVKIPTAIALALLWYLLMQLTAAPWRSLAVVMGALLGSLWHGYASIFMPYAPGIATCTGALALLGLIQGERLTILRSAGIGLLTGFALLCDLIFVILVGLIALLYLEKLVRENRLGEKAFWAQVVVVLGCGAVFPLLFVAYSVSIFGSPTIPYEYEYLEEFRVNMAQGVMGVKEPRLAVAYFLTVHPFRGIFFWSPWILLALWGALEGLRRGGMERRLGALIFGAFFGYLVFNSGYWMWWGGFGMGPRLMLPAFAVLPLGCGLFLVKASRTRCLILGLLLFLSVLGNQPVSWLEPQTPVGGTPQQVLESIQFGDSVEVSQFVYWRAFWP
ncbi:MAG: hypothetical protein SFY68_03900, partial [Candidatus Sumerlaeia bacterium]|nr:hypothetical protein [Candidatus Sumerlaeia bacterium]